MTIFANLANLQWQQVVMWAIGALLIYLAIKKEMEPALLLLPRKALPTSS